jgi:DNA-binding Lrp family transcriptional regulator
MLNRLLELLREGGTRRIRALADELNTTPELIEAMLEDLTRMGYLNRVGTGCSDKCTACPLSGMCVAGGSLLEDGGEKGLTAWLLADKQKEQ